MEIVALSQLIPSHDHDLWFLTERSDFAPNTLTCVAIPFAKLKKVPARRRSAQTGGGCHSDIVGLLEDMFERDYNGRAGIVGGQVRITVQGLNEVYLDFVVRKALPVEGGFDASFKVGPMLEQASLMHFGALEFVDGHPCARGILLVYNESLTNPRHVDVWLAYEWQARNGSSFIGCAKCAYLGSMPFDASGSMATVPQDTPVRGSTGSRVDID